MDQVQEAMRNGPVRYRPHVLLVEDESSVARGLEMVMTEEGYDVELADTGENALAKAGARDFDLMVADLRLPDIDGMEVIQRVKESRPETRVVIITGYPTVSSAVQAVKLGVSDYLHKPFTEEEFKTAVEAALKVRAQDSPEEPVVKTQQERLIQKQEVIRVLNRASQDMNFWRELMENGSEALRDYRLFASAKAAILSGDLIWIQGNIGELTDDQLLFIYNRLEREAW